MVHWNSVFRLYRSTTYVDATYCYEGCGLSLDVLVSRRSRDVSMSRLVSVSAIDVSCPRLIFRQISQVTIIKLIKSVVAVNDSLAELV